MIGLRHPQSSPPGTTTRKGSIRSHPCKRARVIDCQYGTPGRSSSSLDLFFGPVHVRSATIWRRGPGRRPWFGNPGSSPNSRPSSAFSSLFREHICAPRILGVGLSLFQYALGVGERLARNISGVFIVGYVEGFPGGVEQVVTGRQLVAGRLDNRMRHFYDTCMNKIHRTKNPENPAALSEPGRYAPRFPIGAKPKLGWRVPATQLHAPRQRPHRVRAETQTSRTTTRQLPAYMSTESLRVINVLQGFSTAS